MRYTHYRSQQRTVVNTQFHEINAPTLSWIHPSPRLFHLPKGKLPVRVPPSTGEMVQRVTATAAMPEDLSLIAEIHVVEEKTGKMASDLSVQML